MSHRIATSLLGLPSLFLIVSACAPGAPSLEDEDASRGGDNLDGCPTSIKTEAGVDVSVYLRSGTEYKVESSVLQATDALEASGVDPQCFHGLSKYLWYAAQTGLGAKVLGPMIAAGLDPNATDVDLNPLCEGCTGTRTGMTTLHYATWDIRYQVSFAKGIATYPERVTMVRVLLESGADPNRISAGALWDGGNPAGAAAIGGATPLMFVSSWDDFDAATEAAGLLVDAGTDLNVRAWSLTGGRNSGAQEVRAGDTALSLARRKGDDPLVELLLAAGATDWDVEAEEAAARSTSVDEVATILTTKTVDPDSIWTTWFRGYASQRSPIQVLLSAGLDPNAHTWGGKYTPPMASVFQTGVAADLPPEQLIALIDAGADVNDPSVLGLPPLLDVIDRYDDAHYRDVMSALLEAGADVNGRAGDGDTPLLRLMYTRKDLAAEDMLLSAGGDPNAANADGERPLTIAIRAPLALVAIEHLLEQGADLNANAHDGPAWAHMIEHNPLYQSNHDLQIVAPVLDRVVQDPGLQIDLSSPGVKRALDRADTSPLVKPYADVIRARATN